MSGSKGAAVASIPPGARKIIQSLKEIVNCPEAEIYAMLLECDMNPDEAVNRLLAQDTFHEVKSKRDKKKEIKESSETWSRVGNNSTSCVSRSSTDYGGRSTSYQTISIDYEGNRSKPSNKKENGATVVRTISISEATTLTSNSARRSTTLSSAPLGTTMQAENHVDKYSIPLQPSPGFQNNWLGKSGHISMADIVKMGRPQAKPSNVSTMATGRPYVAQSAAMTNVAHNIEKQLPLESENKFQSSQESVSQIPEITHEIGVAEGQLVAHDGWSMVDETPMRSTIPDTFDDASCQPASFSSDLNGANLNSNPYVEEARLSEDNFNGIMLSAESKPVYLSERQIQVEASGDVPLSDDLHRSPSSAFEQDGFEDVNVEVSKAAAGLGQITLHDEMSRRVAEQNPAVIIPDHLQVINAACAQLSFGSFASGTFSGSFASKSLRSNVELTPVTDIASTVDQADIRTDYYNGEQIKPTSSEGVSSITVSRMENIDMPSVSHTEVMRNDTLDSRHCLQYMLPSDMPSMSHTEVTRNDASDLTHGLHYKLPSDMPSVSHNEVIRNDTLDSTHGLEYKLPSDSYAYSHSMQPGATTYSYPLGNGQTQNLSRFSNSIQPNTLQSSLLSPNVSSLRDYDIPFSQLLATQSMSTKYNTVVPSLGGPPVSSLEAVKPSIFSNAQSNMQSLAGPDIPTGLALPQQLALHHYSQPALPIARFDNMISYPYLHQNYNYLPSAAFQQAYTGTGPFQQSPAAVPGATSKYSLPQYKNSVSATTLSQSAALASTYGGFENSANIPGNVRLNSSPASATIIGFDGTLGMQYKEASQYMALQQNENPTLWLHGTGSRTNSNLPGSNIYNYQGQSQQSAFRQNQQLPSQLGVSGYQNYYHSQPGSSMEQQQNPKEGNLNRSVQSQPAHQVWQHSY